MTDPARCLLLLVLVPLGGAYPSGLVGDSCADLKPRHSGAGAQGGPAPFTVSVETSPTSPGQQFTVLLQGAAPFSGFLLQAREPDRSVPVGTFSTTAADARLLTCTSPGAAVAHTSASPKSAVRAVWRPGSPGTSGAVRFHASFVQSYSRFWVDVTSPVLNLTQKGGPGPGSDVGPSRSGCDVTKVCFSQPAACDPSASPDCYFLSAMMLPGGAIRYEMSGRSDGYVAFGFSDDQMMGNDDIYICGAGTNGSVRVQHAFSTGRQAPQVLPLGNVSDVTAAAVDGVIRCSFTSSNPISTQRTSGSGPGYFLMFAYGPSGAGGIQYHSGRFVSSRKIDVSTPQTLQTQQLPRILRAHGTLMLIAWMTTSSVGMLVARYLKGSGPGLKLLNKDIWFVIHVAVMTVTIVATVTAFVLPFAYAGDWSGGAHPVLGCLVLILTLGQSLLAALRCGPQHPLRFLFNWGHSLNGAAIKCLAVAAIFTGLQDVDQTSEQWLVKVMAGFVAWDVLFFVLFEVQKRCHPAPPGAGPPAHKPGAVAADVLLLLLYLLGNLCFLVALLVGVGTA